MSLFVLGAEERLGKENKLIKIGQMIDWNRFEKYFKGFYKNETEDKGGKRPYEVIKMFKAILLGQWYSLSDPDLEESLRVRLAKSFNQNTTLRIGDIRENNSLCLIGGNKLSTLSIGKLEKNARLFLLVATSFKDLKICTVKEIDDNVNLEFPDELNELTSFIVGKIGKNSRLKLPNSLHNLTHLSINGHIANLGLVNGLKIFITETGHDEVTRKLLNAINERLNIANDLKISTPSFEICNIN